MAQARCSGVRMSLGATVPLTISGVAFAKIWMTARMSCLQTASTSKGVLEPEACMKSLPSYLALIHRSLSSRGEEGHGFILPLVLASHTLLAR